MGVYVKGLVWPRCPPRSHCDRLLPDVVTCLPPQDWAILDARSFRSYDDSHLPQNALHTWDFGTSEDTEKFGISPGDLDALAEALRKSCSIGGHTTVAAIARWEPPDDLESTPLVLDLGWPDPYPTWRTWQQAEATQSPLRMGFGKRSEHIETARRSPKLDYIASFYRNLGQGEHTEHAVGLLSCHLTSAVNSFGVWHRDIAAFATDLLWAAAQVATGTGPFYLDPRVARGAMLIPAIAEAIGGGPEPYGGGRQELYWLREREPERYRAPRLGYAVLKGLAARVHDLAAAIGRMGRSEILEAAQRCTTCRFEELGDGGLLWAVSEVDDCVDEFYLRLAQTAFPELMEA